MCVPLDDFDLILGIDFFLKAKAAWLPHLGGLMIMDESRSCFVSDTKEKVAEKGKMGLVSTLNIKRGVKHGQKTYVAALTKVKVTQFAMILEEVV